MKHIFLCPAVIRKNCNVPGRFNILGFFPLTPIRKPSVCKFLCFFSMLQRTGMLYIVDTWHCICHTESIIALPNDLALYAVVPLILLLGLMYFRVRSSDSFYAQSRCTILRCINDGAAWAHQPISNQRGDAHAQNLLRQVARLKRVSLERRIVARSGIRSMLTNPTA